MRSRAVQLLVAVVVVLTLVPLAQAKEGRGKFARQNARQAEVNRRLNRQQARINQGLKNGKLNQGQAQQLEGNDNAIKQQEMTDLKANGGFLTRGRSGSSIRKKTPTAN